MPPPSALDSWPVFFVCLFVCFLVLLFRAAPLANGGSQARGPVGAIAAGLPHSHSFVMIQRPPRSTPQLMATPES